jgi:pimeloyl-ACP methyl ester carboxylesterase
MAWAQELRPDAPDLLALDGKTSRRTHDRSAGLAPVHLVSAFATRERLVLGQEAVAAKSNEIEAIPVLLDKLAEAGSLKGALVSIDAIGCNPKIADEITGHGADYLLAVKANQSHLQGEIERFPDTVARYERLNPQPDFDRFFGELADMWRDRSCPGNYPGELAAEIGCPALIIGGDADHLVPRAETVRLANTILGARLGLAPGGGHIVHQERVDRITPWILDFLR